MKPAYDTGLLLRFNALQFFMTFSLMIFTSVACGTGSTFAQQPAFAETEATQPNWITTGSFEAGETSFLVVETEAFYLRSEASMVLMEKIRDTIDSQIDEIVGSGGCRFVDLDDHFLQHEVVDEEMVIENTITDPDSLKKIRRHVGYALLRFNEEFDEHVSHHFQLNLKSRRLQWTGLAGILGLCWLAAAYGYLRLDNATRHFYSRRLQTLAIIFCLIPLILAIIVAIAWKLF